MKRIFTIALLALAFVGNAQSAYKGKGDHKFQVAASFQDGGTGIHGSIDFGLGENISYGFTATYLLSAQNRPYVSGSYFFLPITDEGKPDFVDRFDAKVRFNANIGNVIGLPEQMDVYPGLNLGIHNFGGHLGFRYFFTTGFGLFTEANLPIAKYDSNIQGPENYHNQFVINAGASFNF